MTTVPSTNNNSCKSQPKDTFFAIDAPPNILDLPTEAINKKCILFWIARSKNENIVVYEAEKSNGNVNHYNSVNGYWLDIDPEYVKKARQKGITTDRAKLTYLEKKMAYGYSLSKSTQEQELGKYRLSLVALQAIECYLITDENGDPHLQVIINGKECYLRKVYVAAKEGWIPTVLYIEIFGIEIETNIVQAAKMLH